MYHLSFSSDTQQSNTSEREQKSNLLSLIINTILHITFDQLLQLMSCVKKNDFSTPSRYSSAYCFQLRSFQYFQLRVSCMRAYSLYTSLIEIAQSWHIGSIELAQASWVEQLCQQCSLPKYFLNSPKSVYKASGMG